MLADADPAARCRAARRGTPSTCSTTSPRRRPTGRGSWPTGPRDPEDRPETRRGRRRTPTQLSAFDQASAGLVAALRDADPADPAWTWSKEQTVGFILRRQAHEALIHRLDAELTTTGHFTELDPALAADGVEEVLDVMFGGCPEWGEFSPLAHYIRVELTDTGDDVWVQLGRFSGTDPSDETHYDEDDIHVVDDPGVEPDAVISAPAGVMDARLWRRGDGDSIHLAGDLHDRRPLPPGDPPADQLSSAISRSLRSHVRALVTLGLPPRCARRRSLRSSCRPRGGARTTPPLP